MIIVWLRQDLRRTDNVALFQAALREEPILVLYILDSTCTPSLSLGSASCWWLHESLQKLQNSFKGKLCLDKGDPLLILQDIIQKEEVSGVYWNRCYDPWQIKRDMHIKKVLRSQGVDVQSFSASFLLEPHQQVKPDGSIYQVFTPFYRGLYEKRMQEFASHSSSAPLPDLNLVSLSRKSLRDLNLMPSIGWYHHFYDRFSPGEEGAFHKLDRFTDHYLNGYTDQRNEPSIQGTSELSAHLHFGEISPQTVWQKVYTAAQHQKCEKDSETFFKELVWREFSTMLLYNYPHMPTESLDSRFYSFPWEENDAILERWQKGETGYPIVDAGMKELWKYGYMHNRVRMIVASFLVKNLLQPWQKGASWFWDTLLDADLANNSASWQWVAGSGKDAAPYFRIFNPILQGQKFDPHGAYVKKHLPILRDLPPKFVHQPWKMPETLLFDQKFTLGKDYPKPIVDLKITRDKALAGYHSIKQIDKNQR